MAPLAEAHGPVLAVDTAGILVVRQQPEVSWVHASAHLARVIDGHPKRHLAVGENPSGTVP